MCRFLQNSQSRKKYLWTLPTSSTERFPKQMGLVSAKGVLFHLVMLVIKITNQPASCHHRTYKSTIPYAVIILCGILSLRMGGSLDF